MPRRPVKNPRKSGFQPGVSGNPSGKPRGTVNKVTISDKVREAFAQLLDNNVDKLEDWLHALAKKNPEKALDIWVRISERFVPMLSRTEITGAEGQAFTPITINLPNIPKIDVTTSIGEGSPMSLPASPAEEVKALGEGSLAEELPRQIANLEKSQTFGGGSAFKIPKPVLSENQLRDLREMGFQPPDSLREGTPTDSSQSDS